MENKKLKVGNVPPLRFPGFEGEWKSKKLGEIATFSKGKGISKSDIEENGLTECIRYGELYTYYGEVINDIKSKTNVDTSNLVLSEVNDVIIPASGETTIDIATASCVLKSGIALGGDLNIIKTENNGVFLSYYLNNKKKMEIANLAQGISVVHLYSSQLATLTLNFPKLEEQNRISTFLALFDARIQTQNKIIEQLETLIKGLREKLFSQETRFREFKDEWKLKRLREIGETFNGLSGKIKSRNIDKSRLLTVKLHLKGVSQNDNTNTLSLGATNYFIRKKGQFIYGKQNLFNGAFGIIPDEFDGFLSSGDVPALDINHSKINTAYLLYFLGRADFYKRLEDLATGSGSKRIHETTLLGVKIDFPTIEEQYKIANFLLSIDGKIEIETNILQKLERQKTYFLANLFI
ncbi:restriction endonuclease subunit S [Elizabethkingia anophelis]|uniref:restriction endonuclease subunit S n=1 Tax=Elizabethkingia anophelis TaxID=1117645 RepID=UPI0009785923|nr:restriction endonuclease subunit S [Elizabethkingia anophelis]